MLQADVFGQEGSWPNHDLLSQPNFWVECTLTAEMANFGWLSQQIKSLAMLSPKQRAKRFAEIAGEHWRTTFGTALSYLANPRAAGNQLLLAVARIVYPKMDRAELVLKLVRGDNWGLRQVVKFMPVYEARPGDKNKPSQFHGGLFLAPLNDTPAWQLDQREALPLITDGVFVIDMQEIRESFQPYFHQPLVRRQLSEFLQALKLHYPALHAAFCDYNATTQAWALQLDQQRSARMMIEQMRNTFLTETKLLTGNMWANADGHVAANLFGEYLNTLTEPARDSLLETRYTHGSLRDIWNEIQRGECIDLISAKLLSLLTLRDNSGVLDSVLARNDAVGERPLITTLLADTDWQPGRRNRVHALGWLESIINNLRKTPYTNAGRLVSALYNMIDAKQMSSFVKQLFSDKPPMYIAKVLSAVEFPKTRAMLSIMDAWGRETPIKSLQDYGQWQQYFEGSRHYLRDNMPLTLQSMTFTAAEFLEYMQTRSPEEQINLIENFYEKLNLLLLTTLLLPVSSAEQDEILSPNYSAQKEIIFRLMSHRDFMKLMSVYAPRAIDSLRLQTVWNGLFGEDLKKNMRVALSLPAFQYMIRHKFLHLMMAVLPNTTAYVQETLRDVLLQTCREHLLAIINQNTKLMNLFNQLQLRQFYMPLQLMQQLLTWRLQDPEGFITCAPHLSPDYLRRYLQAVGQSMPSFMFDRRWLSSLFSKLPLPLVKVYWEHVKHNEAILDQFSLSIANRLHEVLEREEWLHLVDYKTPVFVKNVSQAMLTDLIQFCMNGHEYNEMFKNLVWVNASVMTGETREGETQRLGLDQFMYMLGFFYREHRWTDSAYWMQAETMIYEQRDYGQTFRQIEASGPNSACEINLLCNIFREHISNHFAFNYLTEKFNPQHRAMLFDSCFDRLTLCDLSEGEFAKVTYMLDTERCLRFWEAVQPQVNLFQVLNVEDLGVLVRALPLPQLSALLERLAQDKVKFIKSSHSFAFLFMNLSADRQVLLLDWAAPEIRKHFTSKAPQSALLNHLSPELKQVWQAEFTQTKQQSRRVGLFTGVNYFANEHQNSAGRSQPRF